MKVIFLPQRGSFDESLKNSKIFTSLYDMLDYIVNNSEGGFKIRDLSLSYYCFDNRLLTFSYAVCTKYFGGIDYIKKYGCPQVLGFCVFK